MCNLLVKRRDYQLAKMTKSFGNPETSSLNHQVIWLFDKYITHRTWDISHLTSVECGNHNRANVKTPVSLWERDSVRSKIAAIIQDIRQHGTGCVKAAHPMHTAARRRR